MRCTVDLVCGLGSLWNFQPPVDICIQNGRHSFEEEISVVSTLVRAEAIGDDGATGECMKEER